MITVCLADGTRHLIPNGPYFMSHVFAITGICPDNQRFNRPNLDRFSDGDVVQLVRDNRKSDYCSALDMLNVEAVKVLIEEGRVTKKPPHVWMSENYEMLMGTIQPFHFKSFLSGKHNGANHELLSEDLDVKQLFGHSELPRAIQILIERASKCLTRSIIKAGIYSFPASPIALTTYFSKRELAELLDVKLEK